MAVDRGLIHVGPATLRGRSITRNTVWNARISHKVCRYFPRRIHLFTVADQNLVYFIHFSESYLNILIGGEGDFFTDVVGGDG